MSAVPDYHPGWPGSPLRPDLHGLLDAATAAVAQLADQADLDQLADRDAAAVMGALTTLVGQLDGLRVQVARTVRDRDVCGLRGARNLTGWLRTDARLADDAWKLARLAAAGPDLPKITALLGAGTISLAQAATACWQISQLPAVPVPPVIDGDAAAGRPDGAVGWPGRPDGAAGPQDRPGEAGRPHDDAAHGDAARDDAAYDDAASSAAGESPSAGGRPARLDPSGGEEWAGLWRAGDVHAAADELFAAVLPALDGGQLRQLGAHLREAADTRDRAVGEHDDYARRGLRISRSLYGNGEISGRLHPEAAAQVIAAFDQLGRRTGPDDTRTKAQRWADVLTRLTATCPDLTTPSAAPGRADSSLHADPPAEPVDRAEEDDDQPRPADISTGHDHTSQDPHPPVGPEHGADDSWGDHDSGAGGPGGPVPAAYQRPRVIVTVPLDTLLGRPLAPGATLGSGTPLTAEAARRLACDAEVIRLVTSPEPPSATGPPGDATVQLTQLLSAAIAGLPPPLATPSAVLDIGRKSPGWTPRQRDALHAQYGGHCGFGRCGGPIEVIHHIVHWLHGGKTRIINGFPCCGYHHWLIHEGGWRVKKHPDGTITTIPPPPGWRPGTIYRHGRPVTERGPVS